MITHLKPNIEFDDDFKQVAKSAPDNWQIMEKINEIIDYLNSKENE